MIGKTLGHYQIVKKIGSGGMGVVYKARDLHLDRFVALKTLPPEKVADPDRKRRFVQEAKAASALNHPNIVHIYDITSDAGVDFIAMEYVEGKTLDERIGHHGLPLNDTLKHAVQIADALAKAHSAGIVHRDLKPSNIMVNDDGTVKILDFGLAKLTEQIQGDEFASTATVEAGEKPITEKGVIVGTVAYLSPEQAEGKTVDPRSDIFSFGSVLYEMITGRRAFQGDSKISTISAILNKEPAPLSVEIPHDLEKTITRCLRKDPARRFQNMADLKVALEELKEESESGKLRVPTPARAGILRWPMLALGLTASKKIHLAWGVAIICLVAALALGVLYFRLASVEAPEMRLEVMTPPTSTPRSLSISPDGRRLAFVNSDGGQQRLWLRPLDSVAAQPLAGTEGATYPFWSPDSQSIGFFADGKLKRLDVASGPPQVLASAPSGGWGGTWNRDGVILFAPATPGPLNRVPASGGEPVAITRLDPPRQNGHSFPQFLPDGRHLLYVARGSDQGIYLASLDSAETRRLIAAGTAATYAPPGYLLFMRQGTLFAQRFDAEHGALAGDSVPVADSVALGAFSVSETGMLAYRTVGALNRQRLGWFDRAGKEVGTLGVPDENYLSYPELSPDGRRVAGTRTVWGNADVWLIDAARGVPIRITFDAATDAYPVWSPDGSRIVFSSNRKGTYDLYQKASSGAGNDELLLESSLHKYPNDWSPNDRFLLYVQNDPKTGYDLWVLPLFGEHKPFPLVNTTSNEANGQFSPDGRWVAYMSNETGRYEVYVQPFPGPGGKWQVSTGGGIAPRWRRDGKELFYIAPDGKLMAAPIQGAGQTLDAGRPVSLFQTRIVRGGTGGGPPQYAVAPDGQRFLINITVDEPAASPIIIITNWARALKK